jgi:hypothetical protein
MPTATLSRPVCSSCATAVVEIQLGQDLILQSCSHCDCRRWLRAGAPALLEQVLSVVGETSGKRPLVTTG